MFLISCQLLLKWSRFSQKSTMLTISFVGKDRLKGASENFKWRLERQDVSVHFSTIAVLSFNMSDSGTQFPSHFIRLLFHSTSSIKSPTSLEILRLDGGQQRRHSSQCELLNCSWWCEDQMYKLLQRRQEYPLRLEEQFFFLTTKIYLILNKITCLNWGIKLKFTLHSLLYIGLRTPETHAKKFYLCSVPKFKFGELLPANRSSSKHYRLAVK